MKRVIYSFYIDISKDEFVDNIKTNLNTKNKLKENYQILIDCKIEYADNIGVPFKMFEYDEEYKIYYEYFKKNYPFITTYNIINFYKIHLLYELSKKYNEKYYELCQHIWFFNVEKMFQTNFENFEMPEILIIYLPPQSLIGYLKPPALTSD